MTDDVGIFRVAVGAVILNKENKVLLTQRSLSREHHPGEWEIMTGRLAQGEGFEEALAREAKEELDIKVEPIAPIQVFHFFRGKEKLEHVGVTYLCRHSSGKVKVDGIEEIAFRWVSPADALKIVKDQSIQDAIIRAAEYLGKTIGKPGEKPGIRKA